MNPAPAGTADNGWRARLKLGYETRGGKTVLAENSHSGPLQVQKPLYPEGEVCHTCILHPPGGVVGGDRLAIELSVSANGHALVTTPGATKFYRSGGEPAIQIQNLDVHGGLLEWFPQDSIIFPGARARIETNINLKGAAVFIGWEVLCLGLPTKNERFSSGTMHSSIRLYQDGRPLFIDRLGITSEKDLDSPAGLRGYPVCATLLATGVAKETIEKLRQLLPENSETFLTGMTMQNGLLVCRYLGGSTFEARSIFQSIWTGLRPSLANRDACPPRIWST